MVECPSTTCTIVMESSYLHQLVVLHSRIRQSRVPFSHATFQLFHQGQPLPFLRFRFDACFAFRGVQCPAGVFGFLPRLLGNHRRSLRLLRPCQCGFSLRFFHFPVFNGGQTLDVSFKTENREQRTERKVVYEYDAHRGPQLF